MIKRKWSILLSLIIIAIGFYLTLGPKPLARDVNNSFLELSDMSKPLWTMKMTICTRQQIERK